MRKAKQKSQIPLRVQFRHMPTSDAMKQLIQLKIEPLQKFSTAGSHCEVVVDEMHHWHKGGIYKVSIRYTVPGDRLYVASAEEENTSREFLYSAIRVVVDEIERQLKKQRKRKLRYRHDEQESRHAA